MGKTKKVRRQVKVKQETPWLGLPTDFTPSGFEGFVYLITCLKNDRKYIGKKFFWSKRKVRVKGQKRRKLLVQESDWRYYQSSSDDLREYILNHGVSACRFDILSLHTTRAETNYTEVKEQFSRDVLYSKLPNGDWEYLNHCILNRYYRRKT